MPSKYIIKEYVSGGIYHVYNRGVNKDLIFHEAEDYKFFLYLLKSYLIPASEQETNTETQLRRGLFVGRVEILAFALMPNHYHFLIKQKGERDLAEFMRAVMTSYVSYHNKKYDRNGPLFQGRFKGILVESDDYLLHLSRYIHLNPRVKRTDLFGDEVFTSYDDYLGQRNTKWMNKRIVLDYFTKLDKGGAFSRLIVIDSLLMIWRLIHTNTWVRTL